MTGCFSAAPFLALSATLYVTETGAGLQNGSDWANAYTNIQAAIDAADPGDVIGRLLTVA